MGVKGKRRRLRRYDYRTPGAYFVTFCTEHRRCILGRITVDGECVLSEYGKLCAEYAARVYEKFPGYSIEDVVVMPNHVHALVSVAPQDSAEIVPLWRAIGWWKARTTKVARERGYVGDLWQKSFHDHIVRDESDRLRLLEYIANNPKRWQLDCLYQGES